MYYHNEKTFFNNINYLHYLKRVKYLNTSAYEICERNAEMSQLIFVTSAYAGGCYFSRSTHTNVYLNLDHFNCILIYLVPRSYSRHI